MLFIQHVYTGESLRDNSHLHLTVRVLRKLISSRTEKFFFIQLKNFLFFIQSEKIFFFYRLENFLFLFSFLKIYPFLSCPNYIRRWTLRNWKHIALWMWIIKHTENHQLPLIVITFLSSFPVHKTANVEFPLTKFSHGKHWRLFLVVVVVATLIICFSMNFLCIFVGYEKV